jgi:NAD(P)H-hydrate epimerase
MSAETRVNYDIVRKMQIPMYENVELSFVFEILKESDIVIESLIGVGADENLRGNTPALLKLLNYADAMKIAIDVPAGLNANTGRAHIDAFSADITLTMFASKLGMFLNDGPNHCGEIIVCNIGAPLHLPQENSYLCLNDESAREILGIREQNSDKFEFGRVLVIAGSDSMPGAAALTANSAIKSGAGLVELLTTSVHPALLPEVIAHKLKANPDGTISADNKDLILSRCIKATSIVIGPGIGTNESALKMFNEIISKFPEIPIVIDAEGLRILDNEFKSNKNLILTPHIYEFSKLAVQSVDEIQKDLIGIAKEFATNHHCTLLLKSHPTIITNGDRTILNIGGNSGMATAGSGDVLSGIIGTMAGQSDDLINSTSLAAFVHSRAGDLYSAENDEYTLSASSIIDYLPAAFKSIIDTEIE